MADDDDCCVGQAGSKCSRRNGGSGGNGSGGCPGRSWHDTCTLDVFSSSEVEVRTIPRMQISAQVKARSPTKPTSEFCHHGLVYFAFLKGLVHQVTKVRGAIHVSSLQVSTVEPLAIVHLIVPNHISQMLPVFFRALTLLYNRLKINLPRLVQELEINEEFSEQVFPTARVG